jgi:small nuclear ribonucleoprotein (snRNP)-like protein
MKSKVKDLIDKIVYCNTSNGECYSGVLELESSYKKTNYLIKRAISVDTTAHRNSKTIYVEESKIDKVIGPHIYLKQEKIKPAITLNVKELTNAPF